MSRTKKRLARLREQFPEYAQEIQVTCCGQIYVSACTVYNGREDMGGCDEEAVPDGTESTTQQELEEAVDFVEMCPECCGCGGW